MLRTLLAFALALASAVPASAGMPLRFRGGLDSADGGPEVRLSSLHEKVVLFEFWSTTCGPCREVRPLLEELQKTFADRGLVVLAVDEGEDAATVKKFLNEHPTTVKVVVDPRRKVSKALMLNSEPALALFDVNDQLVWSAVGLTPATKDDLSRRLDRILPGASGSVPVGTLKKP